MDSKTIAEAIGRRLAARRGELSLTLAEVARRCGVRLQQIHKYETGQNVMSAPMLWRLSRCLDVPVAYFFADLDSDSAAS